MLWFFRRRGQLPDYPRQNNTDCEAYPNVSVRVGVVISKRFATLHELETIYSYEDLLDLYEIVYVNNVNEITAMEEAKQRANLR